MAGAALEAGGTRYAAARNRVGEISDLLGATASRLPQVEWFAHLGLLLGWARESGQLDLVVRTLGKSQNPALRAYARLETLLDSPDVR
jgi:hypothetical protein